MALDVAVEGEDPTAYVVHDLSVGGALLTRGPALPVGRDAKVTLPLQGRDLVLRARVLRAETGADGEPRLGLCFRGVPTFVQDLIQSHVLTKIPPEHAG